MIGQTNEAWANGLVATLPARWCGKLLGAWERRRTAFNPARVTAANDAQRNANEALRATVARLLPFAVNDDLQLDSSDGAVVDAAWKGAERCRVRLLEMVDMQQHGHAALRAAGVSADQAEAVEAFESRCELARLCIKRGIAAPAAKYDDTPAVRRMVAARWWTGQLRKAHARAVESAAIELGLVNRSKDCYVSNESLEARRAQNARNAATLEATIARNVETEQEFTLAELAATGPADKAIRRTELMTRINGFERVAIDMRHDGAFFTMTCPSEMHRHRTVGDDNRVVENGAYDGTKPHEAQAHLSGVWARIRAKLERVGVRLYGFRIAEPNHDGTPHWHCLMFADPVWPSKQWHAPMLYPERAAMPRIAAIVRRYALAIPGAKATPMKHVKAQLRAQGFTLKQAAAGARKVAHVEAVEMRARENAQKGAKQHRVDWKPMDPAKGTAAGYIAKYVAKNIDGYRLEKDMYGNDSIETSARVEAWASRWSIRQFQQVGGPPVTVWRELRRVVSVPEDAPAHVRKAFNAVNKVAKFEGRENASVAWNHYVEAQGGVFCGRRYRVRLATVASEARNCYGEQIGAQPVGIQYADLYRAERETGGVVVLGIPRVRTVTVESKRFTWEILRPAASMRAPERRNTTHGFDSKEQAGRSAGIGATGAARGGYTKRAGVKGLDLGLKRAQRAPWTCVNNCTDGEENEHRSGSTGRLPVRGKRDTGSRKGISEAPGDRESAGSEVFRGVARGTTGRA